MIELTKLNGKEFVLNCELIETIDTTPDTVITLTNNKKYIVKDDVNTIIDRITKYKRKIFVFNGS